MPDGRLVGVITIDDAMNVLDEEHEEDMLRLAGVGDEASMSDGAVRDGAAAVALAGGQPVHGVAVGDGDHASSRRRLRRWWRWRR